MSYYTYILLCSDLTFYTGYTTDLERRVKQHNLGKGSKYTASRRPVMLIYYEEFSTRSEAQKRECSIKKLSRAEKERLVNKHNIFGSRDVT